MNIKKRFVVILLIVLLAIFPVAVNASGAQSQNFVDERYELVSLVFRLAESRILIDFPDRAADFAPMMAFYNDDTEYMRLLNTTFGGFVNHPVVEYVIYLWSSGYYPMSNDVFAMAIHLERDGEEFALVDNIALMIMPEIFDFNTWTESNAHEFVNLLNDFYRDTNFGQFFEEHTEFFQEISAPFAENVVNNFNFEWFEQFGANLNNINIFISPSKTNLAFGLTRYCTNTGEWIVYSAQPVGTNFSRAQINHYQRVLAHEIAHSFSNPMAEIWYAENENFRGWVHSTLQNNEQQMLQQGYGIAMIVAYEYVTRAYEILYMMENTNANLWRTLAESRFGSGFTYIENVFAMVTDHTPMLHIIIPLVIIGAVLIIVVLPATLVILWRKRRKLKKAEH